MFALFFPDISPFLCSRRFYSGMLDESYFLLSYVLYLHSHIWVLGESFLFQFISTIRTDRRRVRPSFPSLPDSLLLHHLLHRSPNPRTRKIDVPQSNHASPRHEHRRSSGSSESPSPSFFFAVSEPEPEPFIIFSTIRSSQE